LDIVFFSSKFSILGGLPRDNATYILIIYQNYIIPNLGEYILKISSKSVDNCKSWQSQINFTKKSAKTFFTQKLAKISEDEGKRVPLDFWDGSWKKFEPKKQTFLCARKTTSAKLYSLSWQPVVKKAVDFWLLLLLWLYTLFAWKFFSMRLVSLYIFTHAEEDTHAALSRANRKKLNKKNFVKNELETVSVVL